MTHDELLAKIDEPDHWFKPFLDIRKALRAVVGLHKPIRDDWFNVGETICEECTREEYTRAYPCSTIQTIEKELQ